MASGAPSAPSFPQYLGRLKPAFRVQQSMGRARQSIATSRKKEKERLNAPDAGGEIMSHG